MTLGCKGLITKRVGDGAYFYIIDCDAWKILEILLCAQH